MEAMKLEAVTRTETGKGPNRRLRAAGSVPAITYGGGKDPVSLAVAPEPVIEMLNSERGRNTVVDLVIDGKAAGSALIGEYQYHPVSRQLLHADFIRISANKAVEVKVQLILEGKPEGVVAGGELRQAMRELPISCLPGIIPLKIVVDVTGLAIEETLSVGKLSLPDGVISTLPAGRTVCGVYAARASKEADEDEAAAAKTGDGDGDGDGDGAAADAPADK